MPLITELARAKINLTLKVLGKRPDGYHEIESLVAFADVGDDITLDTEGLTGFRSSGPTAGLIEGLNLAELTLRHLRDAEPRLRLGRINLVKCLPVAAGIGGGSADAAAVLRAIRRANPELASAIDWQSIAIGLGADVLACLADQPCYMRGAGEIVDTLPALPRLDLLLINPLVLVPPDKTARVFRYLAAPPFRLVRRERPAPMNVPNNRVALLELMRQTGNDLLAPACKVTPEIVAVISALEEVSGVELAQLSGSGPTCFGVFATAASATHAAETIRTKHPDWWIEQVVIG